MAEDNSSSAKQIFNQKFKEGDTLSIILTLVGISLTVFPALSITGFFFSFFAQLPFYVIILAATIGSLLFFCFVYPDRKYWYYGIIPGLISGPLVLFATIGYTNYKESIFILEFIIPLVIGVLPGWIMWYYPLRRKAIRDLENI